MMSKRSILATAVLFCLPLTLPLLGQDTPVVIDVTKTPWLEGVTIGEHPTELSPVLPLKIFMENGEAIPATLTEDMPITVVADSIIFDPEPPQEYNGEPVPNPQWTRNAIVSWFFIDWEKNKNFRASSTHDMALNQMVVTPLTPTSKGAVTCHIGRKMRYDLPEPGKNKSTFANASVGRDVKVLDITPPTCGLEISIKDGASGVFWVAENPPDKYPLPKLADVYFSGALGNPENPDEALTVQGLTLGIDMIVLPEQASIEVPAHSIITLRVNGEDNYKLDTSKLKFGICAGAGGEPTPIGEVNAATINLAEVKIPENPHFYMDASDVAGNRQVLFVPMKLK